MKSSIAQLILSKLAELGYITADVLFPKKYPWAAISRPLFGLDDYPRVSRKTLSSIVSRMKRQGLIERKGKGLFKDIVLTKRGRERIERKPLKEKKDLPAADRICPARPRGEACRDAGLRQRGFGAVLAA